MSDPIKRFVEDNRQEFDHLEPSDAVRQRIIAMQRNAPKKGIVRKLYNHRKWVVAASVFMMLFSVLCLWKLNNQQPYMADRTITEQQQTFPEQATPIDLIKKGAERKEVQKTAPSIAQTAPTEEKSNTSTPASRSGNRESVLASLNNMQSTSERLGATIEARKFSEEDELVMDALEATLNNDPSSNVRLAALETMGMFYQNSVISDKLRSSLISQDDPLVQAELISLLSNVEGMGIQDELFALASNPNTVPIVKDEAYTALIHQKSGSELFQ